LDEVYWLNGKCESLSEHSSPIELLLLVVSGSAIGILLFLMEAKWGAITGGCKRVSSLLLALGLLCG
jgi:hypothetical protein